MQGTHNEQKEVNISKKQSNAYKLATLLTHAAACREVLF
jgi:hypothetical protein